jgi:hypothetical protein
VGKLANCRQESGMEDDFGGVLRVRSMRLMSEFPVMHCHCTHTQK